MIMKTLATILMILNVLSQAGVEGPDQKISRDATLKGTMVIPGNLVVPKGLRLTVQKGAILKFGRGFGMLVEGDLVAEGTMEEPVVFTSDAAEPAPGSWNGMQIGIRMNWVRIECAATGMVIGGKSQVSMRHSKVSNCDTGIDVGKGGDLEFISGIITGNQTGMTGNAGSKVNVVDSYVSGNRMAGIVVMGPKEIAVTGSKIFGNGSGINLVQTFSFTASNNEIFANECGIFMERTGRSNRVSGNRIFGNGKGISIAIVSSPAIESNVFENNSTGMSITKYCSPEVILNEFIGNKVGIEMKAKCRPVIENNGFTGSEKAISINESSYPVIKGNVFKANSSHIYLEDRQSSEFEVRVGTETVPINLLPSEKMDKSMLEEGNYNGVVNARGNFWGESTSEMEKAGDDAKIKGIRDSHDVKFGAFKESNGEYRMDRVDYSGWMKAEPRRSSR
jgi:parallel beta-helix repeat protein